MDLPYFPDPVSEEFVEFQVAIDNDGRAMKNEFFQIFSSNQHGLKMSSEEISCDKL